MHITRRRLLAASALAAASHVDAAAQTSPNDRVRLGFIGCGARAHQLLQSLLPMPNVEVAALVDAYTGRVERAQERLGGKAKVYRDYPELLADRSIDGVLVVTPDHWHRRMVLEAIAAGKDVYCEKPLTYSTAEGVEIARAARAAGRIVQVGSQGVSSDLSLKARDIIRSGKLGKVTLIRANYNRNSASGAWIYPIPPDANPGTVNWPMFEGPAARKHPFSLERFFRWRCYRDYSGGIATDLFVHLTTAIHFLMDADFPARAVGMGEIYRWKGSRDVPDTLNAILEYPGGFTVSLSSTLNNQASAEGRLQFLGTEGTLEFGGQLTVFPERARENNGWIVDSWPKKLAEEYYRDPQVRRAELGEGVPKPEGDGIERVSSTAPDPTIAHLAAFVRSIRTREPHWEDARRGHYAAACAHMINQSLAEKRVIEWQKSQEV